jgi:heterodisulfide reductase subunit A
MALKIGVYVCHCGLNIAAIVNSEEVAKFASGLPGVVVAKDYVYMCSDPGQAMVREDIKEFGLNRVVIASCSPLMHEKTFRATVEEAGLNPYYFEMANIREQCSWAHDDKEKATQKAKRLVEAAVRKASLLEALETIEVDVTPAVLVIGGGIAGIHASLDIADAGFKVYLVEKTPSVGGRMAQLDETFPTLDCSSCILTPKMTDVGSHRNIELLTYCEVIEVSGFIGNFEIKVKKKPRYIDVNKCTGCGACAEACRLKGRIPSEFDCGLKMGAASYIPFEQAVPAKYTIDPDRCLMVTKGKCGKSPTCQEACTAGAIDFEQKEEIVEFGVGSIIVATGFDPFDPKLKPELGYKEYDNVITGLELERLSSASGPTFGKISINGKEPKDVVFVHCVGSRDEVVGNLYCSRVCCMYLAKQAHYVKDKIPDARVTVFYIDMRAFGKGFEEFYNRVKEEGVIYRRGNVSEIYKRGDKLIVRAEDTLLGEAVEVETDLVVLGIGMVPRADSDDLVRLLKISKSADGFFLEAHPKLRPEDTAVAGVYLAGCCQGPKDIPDTVAQAGAAAAKAMMPLALGKVKTEAQIASVDEDACRGCGICVEICPYGALELKSVFRFGEFKEVSSVNEVVCKGCGACAAACPSGAMQHKSFTKRQIFEMISAATA